MVLQHCGIQESRISDQLYRMYKEIDDVESELLECQKECATTEIEIYNVNQLKDKGTYVLENVKRRYNDLEEELKEVHCNYLKCIEKTNNETIQQKIDSLTLQRDNLRRELEELNKAADENNKKIMAVKKMIKIQEVSFIYIYMLYICICPIEFSYIFLFTEEKYGANTKIEKISDNARFK